MLVFAILDFFFRIFFVRSMHGDRNLTMRSAPREGPSPEARVTCSKTTDFELTKRWKVGKDPSSDS